MKPGRAAAAAVAAAASSANPGAWAAPANGAADGAADAASAWSFDARSVHHSDALTLRALDAADRSRMAPRQGRNLAYVDDELRLERRLGRWAFSLIGRSQASLVTNKATLELAQLIEQGRRPQGDAHWQVDARFRGFSGAGAGIGYTTPLQGGWSVEVSGQWLALGSWHQRFVGGAAAYDAATQAFGFDIASDERYNRLRFDYQSPFARNGYAALVGAALSWSGDSASVKLALYDGGRLQWSGIPRQSLSLIANRQGVDPDGFVIYGPLLQGSNTQASGATWQPWRARWSADGRLGGPWHVTAGMAWLGDFGTLPWLGLARQTDALTSSLQWQWHERRLTAALDWQHWRVRIGADRLGAGAHSREAMLSYRWTLP